MSIAWQRAATWRIASELASSIQSSRIVQVGSSIPGDHAIAVVADGRGQLASLSAASGILVTAPRGTATRTWDQIRRDGTGATAAKVLRGLDVEPARRPTTRRRRTYRIIAAVLESQVSSPHTWDVIASSLAVGHSGLGPGAVAPAVQPGAAWDVFGARALAEADASEVWGMSRDGYGVVALHDGAAWLRGGKAVDLMRASSKGEPRIAADIVTSAGSDLPGLTR